MSDKMRVVLEEWFRRARTADHPVPNTDEIARLAAGTPGPPGSIGAAWQRTIDHFSTQVRFGVHEPIPHLPMELSAPEPTLLAAYRATLSPPSATTPLSDVRATPTQDSETPAAVRVRVEKLTAHLVAWKAEQIAARPHNTALHQLKDRLHLRPIAQADARTAADVAKILPHSSSFQELVPELVSVIAQFHANSSGSGPVQAPGTVTLPDTASGSAAWVVTPVAVKATSARQHPDPAPGIDPDGFAPAIRAEGADRAPDLTLAVTETKGVLAAWRAPQPAAAVTIYRVVTMDRSVPWSPEVGRLVTVTEETHFMDDADFTSPVRYYSVWANVGGTLAEAKAAQPIAVAQGRAVALVQDFDPREEEGAVVARWRAPGATRVHVYRIPLEEAAEGRGKAQYRIQASRLNTTGFQDNECEPGRHYLYQAVIEIMINGTAVLGDPVDREVQPRAVLAPVIDLTASLHGPESAMRFDLSWTQPAQGEVVIFRTKSAPPTTFEDQELVLSQIENYGGLTLESRLPYPAEVVDGVASVTDVPWPKEWAWAHFTPATMIGERVAIGRTVTKVRVDQIVDAELHERVNEQLITFTWPHGATLVRIFRTGADIPADAVVNGSGEDRWELTEDSWKKEGGFRAPTPLNAHGCAIHLLPLAHYERRTYPAPPATVIYPGLYRITYGVERRRSKSRRAGTLVVTLAAADDSTRPPQFFLVANDRRFPLDRRDGHPLPVTRRGYDGIEPQRILTPEALGPHAPEDAWEVDLDDVFLRTGWTWFYLRLFADLPPEQLQRVAVLDPPLPSLIVSQT